MRTFWHDATAHPIPASGTIPISSRELVGAGVVVYGFSMTGNGGVLGGAGGIQRIKLKADGEVLIELTAAQLVSYLAGSSAWAASLTLGAATEFWLPCNLPWMPNESSRDMCQFPAGAAPSMEIETGSAGDGTGSLQVSAIRTDPRKAKFRPVIRTQAMGVSASSTNQAVNLTVKGLIQGFGMATTGLDRLRARLNGLSMLDLRMQGGTTDMGAALLELPRGLVTNIDPTYFLTEWNVPAGQGSQLELETGAGWNGTTEEVFVHSIERVPGAEVAA